MVVSNGNVVIVDSSDRYTVWGKAPFRWVKETHRGETVTEIFESEESMALYMKRWGETETALDEIFNK